MKAPLALLFWFSTLFAAAQAHQSPIEVIPLKTGTNFRFKGLAIDEKTSTAYLGSYDKKEIVAVSLATGKHEILPTPYSGKLNGMGCYIRDGILYAVMNEVDDNPNHQPISVLALFDLDAKKFLRAYESKGVNGRNHFNHVVVDAKGTAYISNTLKASLFKVETKATNATLTEFFQHKALTLIHGIDLSPDGSKLFVTSYESGIRVLDIRSGKLSEFSNIATAGDDGLKYDGTYLFGVGQNSLKKYHLDPTKTKVVGIDTLIVDHKYFNDARCLHLENKLIYCLGNIEFEPVTFRTRKKSVRNDALTDTYIIKLTRGAELR